MVAQLVSAREDGSSPTRQWFKETGTFIGKAYTAMLDLQVGDEFTIKFSKKKGVTLVPVGSEDEEGEED